MSRHFAISGLRPVLTGAQSKVIEFPSPMNGRITQLLVRIAEANGAGDAVFDVNINDVSVYASPGDRAKIEAGDTSGTSVINTEVSLNQMITVDLDAAPLGGISGLYVILQLDDSPTVQQYVENVYQQAFRRDPTGTELTNAVNDLTSGCNSETALAATLTFLTSIFTDTEYTSSFGATNAEYVEDLYQAILARPSDSGGKTFWIAQIVGGMSRNDVRSNFNFSTEHVNYRVVGWCPHVRPLANAVRIQDKDVDSATPSDLDVLQFDTGSNKWVPQSIVLPDTGPGADTYGGGGDFIESIELDDQGRVVAITHSAPSGGGGGGGGKCVLYAMNAPNGINMGGGGGTTYLSFGFANADNTEAHTQFKMPFAGTLKNLYTHILCPGDVNPTTTVRINGSDTTIVTHHASGSGDSWIGDTTHTASVSAGDLISLSCIETGAGFSPATFWAFTLEFDPA